LLSCSRIALCIRRRRRRWQLRIRCDQLNDAARREANPFTDLTVEHRSRGVWCCAQLDNPSTIAQPIRNVHDDG
jgi:hypothetical protein